jgi:hypothetical protein
MKEITFQAFNDEDSDWLVASWDAPDRSGGITTQGHDLQDIQQQVSEAVEAHFDEGQAPRSDRRVTVPMHGSLAPGILRQADVSLDESLAVL